MGVNNPSNSISFFQFWPSRGRSRFQILSDLHLEVGQQYDQFVIRPAAPFLILAGDIGRLIDYGNFLAFLERHCESFEKIFLVLGNHEFYGTSRADGLLASQRLVNESSLHGKVALLERTRYDVVEENVVVLGCTLHSYILPESQDIVRYKIQDFQKIEGWTTDDHNAQHQQDVEWLASQISSVRQEKDGKKKRILVVTHHAPTTKGTSAPEHADNAWSSAFSTDLIGNPKWNALSDVQWWVFGHTHYTNFTRIGQVKVISNQRGYVLPKAPYLVPTPKTYTQRLGEVWTRWIDHGKIYDPQKTITV